MVGNEGMAVVDLRVFPGSSESGKSKTKTPQPGIGRNCLTGNSSYSLLKIPSSGLVSKGTKGKYLRELQGKFSLELIVVTLVIFIHEHGQNIHEFIDTGII